MLEKRSGSGKPGGREFKRRGKKGKRDFPRSDRPSTKLRSKRRITLFTKKSNAPGRLRESESIKRGEEVVRNKKTK